MDHLHDDDSVEERHWKSMIVAYGLIALGAGFVVYGLVAQ